MKNKVFRKILRGVLIFLSCILILILVSILPIDRTPYQKCSYYKETVQSVNNVQFSFDSAVKVGWAKVNITPSKKLPLVSYGIKKEFESIKDSVFVRAFVFKGNKKSAFITLDLLIFPPALLEKVKEKLAVKGFSRNDLYLSATHTHNSFGGWAPHIAGNFFAGSYDEEILNSLSDKIFEAVTNAEEYASKCRMGYSKNAGKGLVINRLVQTEGTVDPWLRQLWFENEKGEKAVILSFAAHANCLSSKDHSLSCDYPGEFVNTVESLGKADFAAFAAGAVGSMGPGITNKKGEKLMHQLSSGLTKLITPPYQWFDTFSVSSTFIPVSLRDPHFKISKDYRIRPWIFNTAFGTQETGISVLKINNVLLLGTPCDFSGELVKPLEQKASLSGMNLMVTSFNGGYIGYITKDEYYDYDKSETRAMNWFGPYNGNYFSELMELLIKKAE